MVRATAFEYCFALHDQGGGSGNGEEVNEMIQCVANYLEQGNKATVIDLRSWMLVVSASLVFSMQAGFAMLCAGCVRKKNVANTMLKNLLDACGVALAFFAVGFGFAFGNQDERTDLTFIGWGDFFNTGDIDYAFWFYEYAISAATVTIVAGALAERCKMTAYFSYSIFLAGFVYPVIAHGIWSTNGFLSPFYVDPLFGIGVIDFAGSGVVHLTGGTVALIALCILGSRRGRFYDATTGSVLDEPKTIPGHSVSLQMLGTMLLWFGWHGFNPGSALLIPNEDHYAEVGALAAVNTSLAAAAGAISALFCNMYIEKRRTGETIFELEKALNGSLAGLVAITAGCATIENWATVIVGMVAGILYLLSSKLLIHYKVDDAVDAVPIHLFNGAWGLISTGLFSSPQLAHMTMNNDKHPGLFYTFHGGDDSDAIAMPDFSLLGCQILGVIFIIAWTTLTMLPFFVALNTMGWFRTETIEELVGLDIAYGGAEDKTEIMESSSNTNDYIHAYTDYKANMMKERLAKIHANNSRRTSINNAENA